MRTLVCTLAFVLALASAASIRAGSADTLGDAEQIRAEVQALGASFVVTEASSTEVVESLTLLSHPDPLRVVPAAGGVYYAICARGARCPYPGRRGARLGARLPRRMALELALRTFARTPAGVVVVSLPTSRPTLLVLERQDVTSASRDALDRSTLSHVYAIRSLVPVSDVAETLVLARIPFG